MFCDIDWVGGVGGAWLGIRWYVIGEEGVQLKGQPQPHHHVAPSPGECNLLMTTPLRPRRRLCCGWTTDDMFLRQSRRLPDHPAIANHGWWGVGGVFESGAAAVECGWGGAGGDPTAARALG